MLVRARRCALLPARVGQESLCALLVAVNSAMQLALFAVYTFLFNSILLPSLDVGSVMGNESLGEMFVEVFINVVIYLGIPFGVALVLYFALKPAIGEKAYARVCSAVSPVTLGALLFTIVIMFGIKVGDVRESVISHVKGDATYNSTHAYCMLHTSGKGSLRRPARRPLRRCSSARLLLHHVQRCFHPHLGAGL